MLFLSGITVGGILSCRMHVCCNAFLMDARLRECFQTEGTVAEMFFCRNCIWGNEFCQETCLIECFLSGDMFAGFPECQGLWIFTTPYSIPTIITNSAASFLFPQKCLLFKIISTDVSPPNKHSSNRDYRLKAFPLCAYLKKHSSESDSCKKAIPQTWLPTLKNPANVFPANNLSQRRDSWPKKQQIILRISRECSNGGYTAHNDNFVDLSPPTLVTMLKKAQNRNTCGNVISDKSNSKDFMVQPPNTCFDILWTDRSSDQPTDKAIDLPHIKQIKSPNLSFREQFSKTHVFSSIAMTSLPFSNPCSKISLTVTS